MRGDAPIAGVLGRWTRFPYVQQSVLDTASTSSRETRGEGDREGNVEERVFGLRFKSRR